MNIERLEFVGKRLPNGTIEGLSTNLPEWPERLLIGGVIFRREETEDRGDGEDRLTLAWYVAD